MEEYKMVLELEKTEESVIGEAKSDLELKELFLESIFEVKVIRYALPVDKKLVDFKPICLNEGLDALLQRIYMKYPKKHSYVNFMYEAMVQAWQAIERFQIRDEGSWEAVLEGTDKANIGRIFSSIRVTIENEMIRFMNPEVKYTRGEANGEKGQHVQVKFNMGFLDASVDDGEGFKTSLIQNVGSDKGFWGEKEGYKKDFFTQWYLDNKSRILTASQNNFLKNLAKCQHEKDGYTENDIQEVTGVPSFKINTKLNKIKERVLKAWEKENPLGNQTYSQIAKEKERDFWMQLMELVYHSESDTQNMDISEWIFENLENEILNNIITDTLTTICNISNELNLSFVKSVKERKQIEGKVLYKIIDAVTDRLEELDAIDTEAVKFYKKPEEMGRWTKEAHEEYGKYYKEFTQQPCYVYKLEENGTKGELLKVEEWKSNKKPSSNLIEVLPTGMKYETPPEEV